MTAAGLQDKYKDFLVAICSNDQGYVVNGDGTNTSDEVCIGEECFYVMYSDDTSVTMLAKYNLFVGNVVTSIDRSPRAVTMHPIENPTGIQDSRAKGSEQDADWNYINFPWYGTVDFASTNYWRDAPSFAYIYDSNSLLYNYVENYKTYLESQGVKIEEARIIKLEDLEVLGCDYWDSSTCIDAPSWVYSTSYWTGIAVDDENIDGVWNNGLIEVTSAYDLADDLGVRPVIVIDRELL